MILNFARSIAVVTFAVLTLATVSAVGAGDWPFPRADQSSSGATATQLPEKLDVLWEFKADDAVEATPAIVGDAVYIADATGTIYCIDVARGQERWRLATELGFTTGPSVQAGLLVIGDLDGKVYAVDAASGKLRWTAQTDAEVSGAAAFYNDLVLVTSQDGKLYALAAADGKSVWTYETSDQIRCSPTIIGDRTFLGGCDGQLHAINLADGKAASEPLPLGGPTGSTPAVLGDFAYLPIMDGAVIAFDWKSNREVWRHEDEVRAQEYRSSAAVKDNLVVVSSQNKQVDALDAKTGKPVWQMTLRRRADASPVIAGDDCWIAATDGRLIRLSLKDGAEKWTFEINGQFIASPAVAGDRLFIGDSKGIVRCFGADR
ncbi:MAG: PQQ-binding-like beta-propeller repeat protein [Planctomycetaceae bacterium]